MGIFNKIRKAFRKGEALPHQHGPAVKLAKTKADPAVAVSVKIVKATTDDKPATIPSEYAKAVVKKQKAASKTKPSKDAENKKPATKKAPAKKAPAKKPVTKAPAKKSTPKKK